jgi:hypothetical protein
MTTKTKIYSPIQLAFMSGLPVAAVFGLAKNFDALGDKAASRKTILWGGLFVVWYFCLMFFSEPRDRYFFWAHFGFVNIAYLIAARYQMSNFAISYSKSFDFQSDEMVGGVMAVAAMLLIAVLTVVYLALESLGIPPVLE